MKFNINGYSQEKLIENGLDVTDSLILRVLADMYISNSSKLSFQIIDNEKYMWCTYGYLLEQIPIIGSEKTLKRRFEKFIEKGILKKQVLTKKKGVKGKYLFIAFGENYSEITEYKKAYEPKDKMSLTKGQNVPDQRTKCPVKDSSNNNSSNNNSKDKKNNIKKENLELIQESKLDNSKKEKLIEWINYRYVEIKKPLKTTRTVKTILNSNWIKQDNAIKFIQYCMNHEWQGLEQKYYDNLSKGNQPPKKKVIDYGAQEQVIPQEQIDLYEKLGIN